MAEMVTIYGRHITGCFHCRAIFVGQDFGDMHEVMEHLRQHVKSHPEYNAAHAKLPTLVDSRGVIQREADI